MQSNGIVGSITVLGIGVIVIAAIYQLGTNSSNVVSAGTTLGTNTLGALFK